MDEGEILKALITAIFGGVIATFLKSYFDKSREIALNLNKITEDKYQSLLVFMACAIDINNKRFFALNERVEKKTAEDYLNQIKEYYYHSVLYSSDAVILSLKKFIEEPSMHSYIKSAQTMRKDLWKNNTKLSFNEIELKNV